MRREQDLADEGQAWLERGGWADKLERREGARVCGEVVGGFEEVCNGWRERLVAQERIEAQMGVSVVA